ncbi:MAG: hypothetical protein KF847_19415 [Pirellulales bacterium]|nr:hypothetical protein [Pirellulales bacterium]
MTRIVPLFAALMLLAPAARGDLVTQWTFEGDVTTPSTGAGTASLVGVTATFATGNGGGRGWNTTSYAAQGVGSGTRGVEFMVSTAGYEHITLSFDHRASGTASRWAEVLYTADGGTSWTSAGNNGGGLSPHDNFYSFNFDLSSILGVNDNPLFGFRIVSIFSPQAFDQNASLADFAADTAYMRANAQASYTPGGGTGTGNYETGGTWRFDNVTINGTAIAAVPEASSFLFAGLVGCVTAGAYWTRRRGR